ncbi:glycosyltransferase 87 family protein [Sulfobacillus harzensis]|uniref:DUF2029 domain-containing protein n=1 Tax=Sulfobacillus harzensis TaxID=2729629 RepID=A0A7Y0L639_9FIRM|nr:glycosyltransferase 87 family protein [Sulfobacillus harzensis]NMP24008.1 DUF2029 domain-containing protein [Sulfobacillus harzensis]
MRGLQNGERLSYLAPLIIGLASLTVDAARLMPPHALMPLGHPDFNYYAYSYRHASYSDVVALYASRRLYLHQIPYLHNVIEYPVIIGLYMSLMAAIPAFSGYFVASSVGLGASFALALYALCGRGREAQWWWALSPLIFFYGLMNWDLLGIATWGMAIWAYERGFWRASGVWGGLGVATKFFPVVLLLYLGYGLWRRERLAFRQFLLGALITGIGMNAPFAIFGFQGWSHFFTFNSGRTPDPGLWAALVGQHLLTIADVNLLSLALTAAGGLGLLALVRREVLNPVAAAASALAWWLLCNKVYSPQYMLWVYYAALWTEVGPIPLTIMNLAGCLDFGLAMRWMALGTSGSPLTSLFVRMVPVPVILVRDLTLAFASLRASIAWPLHNRSQARQV